MAYPAPRARVEHLLGRRLRFTLRSGEGDERDERVVTGTVQCLDGHRNFILRDASELRLFRIPTSGGVDVQQRRRALGAALIPGKHVQKVEALAGDLDQATAASASPSHGSVDISISGTGLS